MKRGMFTMTYSDWREMDDDTKANFLGFEDGADEVKKRLQAQIDSLRRVG